MNTVSETISDERLEEIMGIVDHPLIGLPSETLINVPAGEFRSIITELQALRPTSEARVSDAQIELEKIMDVIEPHWRGAGVQPSAKFVIDAYCGLAERLEDADDALTAAIAVETKPVDRQTMEKAAWDAVQNICEWDDRTSPDGYEDYMILKPDELHRILIEFAELAAASQAPQALLDAPRVKAELIQRMEYRIGNPSAWPEGFDEEASEMLREVVSALQSDGEGK